ncbi:sulfotransferase family protein [Tautonia rosea]|uniref:sulfotransferase family protein n=1 Tax=Tautonia rosea TaxID=2728037 RepID=UPI001473C4A3|nr:sulfotransferase [Tautonia rosea]
MTSSLIEHPVFLVGSERSGSTMLRLMLQHHPLIAYGSEAEFIVQILSDDRNAEWPDHEKVRNFLELDRKFRKYNLELDPSLAYPDLARSFLAQILERKPGSPEVVGVTIHYDYHRLPKLWPNARYIHLLRDPRDVARSVIGMGWAGNVWNASKVWKKAEHQWDVLRSQIDPERFTEIRFEELTANPTEELTRLCSFLGIPYDAAMLSYPEHSTYDAPDPKLTYQWKRKLSEHEVQLVESFLGDVMESRGYPRSGLPRIDVDPAEQKRLDRQNYWYKVKHRMKFMGPSLFTADYLARRIAPPAIRRMVQQRVDALVNANLK